MLAGLLPVYVDRFARAWHRLSIADASAAKLLYDIGKRFVNLFF